MVEDGAPVHFGTIAGDVPAITDIPNLPHPPSSPDLNPIEGCWRLVKQKLRKVDRRATSLDGLWADIQKAWQMIDQETVDGMIMSMEERRKAVLLVKGAVAHW